jgi:hypothetical protein
MNTPNFSAILDQPASDAERPKPIPVGTYVCLVSGLPRHDKSSKKQTPFVEFTLKILQAQDDVDKEALEEMGGVRDKTIRATYYLTEDAKWRLRKFLEEDLQIECGDKTFSQMIDEAPGQQCLAFVKHQASDDGQSVYAQLASTAPID